MEEIPKSAASPDQSVKKGLRSEMIVALSAIVVSIMTLSVYIFQARIMMDQQHTSVWPYVEWVYNYISEENQEFYISVINKGVGPALVRDSKIYLDGKLYKDYSDLIKDLVGEGKRDSLWIVYSGVDNSVMAPGEEVKIFHVKSWRGTRIPMVDSKRFNYTLCYCSIYKDCWTTDGTNLVEGQCK
ncbi:MAG: hypothetical protein KIT62_08400 [Cyclobacteriaceae bacterium]|nr:hypothetical protein [Cyclobacteriaceae bacterium]